MLADSVPQRRRLMTRVHLILPLALALWSHAPANTLDTQSRVRIYSDHAHGEHPLPPPYSTLAAKLGAEIVAHQSPITAGALQGYRLVILRAPNLEITADERAALVGFVKGGGSLLLVVDEERRQPLATTRVNDLIEPFGLKLTADTPYRHNTGAIAKKGLVNAADRELPYSGGRAIEGGQAFAWQLDQDGTPAQPFAAVAEAGAGGKVVVMAEGMASLFLGQPEGVRLTGVPNDPMQTTYWGKDSVIFMEELLTWLIR
jgi:hypothetical protein